MEVIHLEVSKLLMIWELSFELLINIFCALNLANAAEGMINCQICVDKFCRIRAMMQDQRDNDILVWERINIW